MTDTRVRVAFAGDTMLGRGVAETLRASPPGRPVAPEVADVLAEADLVVLNLECCVSDRGEPWPDPRKPFFFRAPPAAADLLAELGVDAVTLANNHALDYGPDALLDTIEHLRRVGIAAVGAGADEDAARRPVLLEARGVRLALLGLADHPAEYAAAPGRPGVAYSDLADGLPAWVEEAVRGADADAVVVTPHWGPNMRASPLPRVRRAAAELLETGATLVAGHSAHVFHGVGPGVLYDLGDFVDDYRVDPVLRNDLGLVFIVTLAAAGPVRLEAVPVELEYCHTRLARPAEARWIARRFRRACAELGTEVTEAAGRLVVEWPSPA